MTSSQEYLLQCLAEEAAEVAQAASKCLRFGIDNQYPGYEGTALDRLVQEVYEFRAVFEWIEDEIEDARIPYPVANEKMTAKRKKLAEMMEYSRKRGILR